MKMIQKKLIGLEPEDYYIKHLQIVNQFFPDPMTNKEVGVLATFISIDGELIQKARFGTTARKMVMDKLRISPGGLGNYLKILEKKGFIYRNDYNVFEVKDYLLPEEITQGYQFKITKKNG